MAFAIADWLLSEIRDIPTVRPELRRSIECLGNALPIPDDVLSALPALREPGVDLRPFHMLRVGGQAVAVLDLAAGKLKRLPGAGTSAKSHALPRVTLRPDGRPGCPLAYQVLTTHDGETTLNGPYKTGDAQRFARNFSFEHLHTELVPVFALPQGFPLDRVERNAAQIDALPQAPPPHETVMRIVRSPPEGLGIVDGSLPVVAFGDTSRARIATISLNPSDSEFLDPQGNWLLGNDRRLESLRSLGRESSSELTLADVEACFARSNQYFQHNPLSSWFRPMNAVLQDAWKADYFDGSACHLDLVQWATKPKWSQLGAQTQQTLIQQDMKFLKWQISTMPEAVFVINGATALHMLRAADIAPIEMDECHVALETSNGRVFMVKVLAGFRDGRQFFAWNQVVAQWRAPGARAAVVDALRQLAANGES